MSELDQYLENTGLSGKVSAKVYDHLSQNPHLISDFDKALREANAEVRIEAAKSP